MMGMGGGGQGGDPFMRAAKRVSSEKRQDEDGEYLNVEVKGAPMPMQGMDEEMESDGAYESLSPAGKRAYDTALQGGQVPLVQELESQGLSPEEADLVADMLEGTFDDGDMGSMPMDSGPMRMPMGPKHGK